jgi:probable rRNA maturation factor
MNRPKNINNYDFKEKVIKIFIHGFLHLLNFNHIKQKEYQIMFREEQKIFRSVKKILI